MIKMNNLDSLADQIYNEGVEKANTEADKILENARNEAKGIINRASIEADQILKKAKTEGEKERKSVQNEIQVKARQIISDLEKSVEELLVEKLLEKPAAKSFNEEEFVKELILSAMNRWSKSDEIELTLPDQLYKEMREYILERLDKKLEDITIRPDNKLENGFVIIHRGEGYFLSFTKDDFVEYLKPYFSKQIRSILFEKA
ncbi:MAG: hypothetical protein R3345_08635 [Fulvivirga sp.]|nr:hypothetical protein [Fulvivirga sp.]